MVTKVTREVYADHGYFFFQAEDGIRDYKVTGVQTCALPISTSGGELDVFKRPEVYLAEYRRMAERIAPTQFGGGAAAGGYAPRGGGGGGIFGGRERGGGGKRGDFGGGPVL